MIFMFYVQTILWMCYLRGVASKIRSSENLTYTGLSNNNTENAVHLNTTTECSVKWIDGKCLPETDLKHLSRDELFKLKHAIKTGKLDHGHQVWRHVSSLGSYGGLILSLHRVLYSGRNPNNYPCLKITAKDSQQSRVKKILHLLSFAPNVKLPSTKSPSTVPSRPSFAMDLSTATVPTSQMQNQTEYMAFPTNASDISIGSNMTKVSQFRSSETYSVISNVDLQRFIPPANSSTTKNSSSKSAHTNLYGLIDLVNCTEITNENKSELVTKYSRAFRMQNVNPANQSQSRFLCAVSVSNCTAAERWVQEFLLKHNSLITRSVQIQCLKETIVNCSGRWWRLNKEEFQVLENKSILVNATNKLYNWSEYVWENLSVWVCESDIGSYSPLVKDDTILSNLTTVCMAISVAALIFVLITYSLFIELRTPSGINLMNLTISILFAQLLWLAGSGETDNHIICTAVAVLLQYFFLVSFLWTSIIAFDTWRAFTAKCLRLLVNIKRKRLRRTLQYTVFVWLSVLVYVAICVTLDRSDIVSIGYGSREGCWIADDNAKIYFFGIPVGLVIIFNIIFFSMTVKVIKNTRNQARIIAYQSERRRQFGVYVRIASLMGFTWVLGLTAVPFGWLSEILVYAFVVLNSLQGVYIAIAFAFNKRTRKLYKELIKGKNKPPKTNPVRQARNPNPSQLAQVSHCVKENFYSNIHLAAV